LKTFWKNGFGMYWTVTGVYDEGKSIAGSWFFYWPRAGTLDQNFWIAVPLDFVLQIESKGETMSVQKTVWILNQLSGFGIQKFKRLQEKLGDLSKLLDSEVLNQLRLSSEWGADFVRDFHGILASSVFEREVEQCEKAGIRIISLLDPDYPKNLSAIYDPPFILYVKGTLIPEDEVAIAIVGSRHPTTYGMRCSNRFASELAERGLTIVSGFARGIDGEAHRGALKGKGRTIAVLGSGLDVIYPKEHTSLYGDIVASGAIVSEFPIGTVPAAFNFPRRNRIISGLAIGVLVVEASQRSGSLITARIAAEEGREVYVIPGPIDSIASGGTNQLIQNGAKLVTQVENILEDLAPQIRASINSFASCHNEGELHRDLLPVIASEAKQSHKLATDSAISEVRIASASFETPPRNDDSEDPVLKLLANQPLSFDEIAIGLNENPNEIRSRMTQLELKGVVKRVFGGRYVRS